MPCPARLRPVQDLHIQDVADRCQEAAVRAVEEFSELHLAAHSVEQLTDYVVADKVPQPIQLDIANDATTSNVVTVPSQQGLAYGGIVMPGAARPAARGLELHLHIPYTGSRQAFIDRPSQMLSQPPVVVAVVGDREVIFSVIDASMDAALVDKHLLDQERNLLAWVELVNADIGWLGRQIRGLVAGLLAERLSFMRQRDDLLAALSIPVRHVDAGRALEIPVQRATAVLTPAAPAPGGRPSGSSLMLLNANCEGTGGEVFVGGETENGAGKTDILVRHQGLNAFIGECKFWDGPSKFGEAIEQLLSYTVWRDTKAAIISSSRDRTPRQPSTAHTPA
jgi:hypothetical protein